MTKSYASGYPFDSLLATEIARQPDAWLSTLDLIQSARTSHDFGNSRVILTGAGTSAFAGMAIAEAWPGARAIATTDLLLRSRDEIEGLCPGFSSRGLLVSLARSGDSPESTAVVSRVQRLFPAVRNLAIVCSPNGRLARSTGVDVICLDPMADDRSLAMTGSFSNLALAGLCLLHRQRIAAELPAICARLSSRLLDLWSAAETVAASISDRIVVLTSAMHGLAVEASLKVVELTAGSVLGVPETFLGLRHGPASVLREETPVLCFRSNDDSRRLYERDLIEDLKSKGMGRLIVIGDASVSTRQSDLFVPAIAPSLPDNLRTPFEIVFAQMVAYHASVRVGRDPDNPSPDGVVTRVVRPFVIHEDL